MSEDEKQESDNTAELVVWVAYNEDGSHDVSIDSAADALDNLNGSSGGEAQRVVAVTLKVTLPKVAEVSIDIPDEAGTVESIEAA